MKSKSFLDFIACGTTREPFKVKKSNIKTEGKEGKTMEYLSGNDRYLAEKEFIMKYFKKTKVDLVSAPIGY